MNALTADPQPVTIIIFASSGDLTARKLVPALYEAGSWGPAEAEALLSRAGHAWLQDTNTHAEKAGNPTVQTARMV